MAAKVAAFVAGQAGSSDTGGARRSGSGGGLFGLGDSVKDRVIVALISALVGSTGALGFTRAWDPRPDPWTATEDRLRMTDFERELKEYMTKELRPFDAHIEQSADGYRRIATLESTVRLLEFRLNQLSRYLDQKALVE